MTILGQIISNDKNKETNVVKKKEMNSSFCIFHAFHLVRFMTVFLDFDFYGGLWKVVCVAKRVL